MLKKLDTFARWSRRHGLKLAQLAILAWIAVELHGINQQASAPVDPADVAEIADRLDDIVDAMHGSQASADADADVDKIALRLDRRDHRDSHSASRAPQSAL